MKQVLSQIHAEQALAKMCSARYRQFLLDDFSGNYDSADLQEKYVCSSRHALHCLRWKALQCARLQLCRPKPWGTGQLTDTILLPYALRSLGCSLRFIAASLGISYTSVATRISAAYRAGLPRIRLKQKS